LNILKNLLNVLKSLQNRKELKYDLDQIMNFLLRDSQKIPIGKWNIWLLMTGRGFGKTFTGSNCILQYVLSGKYKKICLISKTIEDVKKVMIEGESGILKVSQKYIDIIKNQSNSNIDLPKSRNLSYLSYINPYPLYKKSENKLVWENGAEADFYSSENIEKLRGPQFDLVWIDEAAKFDNAQEILNQLLLCLRIGSNPKMIITTTPRPTQFIKNLVSRTDIYITYGSTHENAQNLSESYLNSIKSQFEGTKFGDQEISGKIISKDHILWSEKTIEKCRLSNELQYQINDLIENNLISDILNFFKIDRVVVSIDPAVTNRGDETGIIVSGIDSKDNIYILEDKSGIYSPDEWCKICIELYNKWNANTIIAEVNNGGDLVEKLIRSYNKNILYKSVYATKGKISRMEPIFGIYEQNRVKHINKFTKLEHQMVNIEEYNSPDRIDALVWGIKDLLDSRNTKIRVSLI
jgi:phage terminase large subunit-like protein